MSKSFYETLGVAKTASDAEIKAAYRKLLKQHHPDLNPGDKAAEAKTKEINEAYETLSDPQKRAAYDNPRPSFGNSGGGGFQGGFEGFGGGGGSFFDDILSAFGMGGGRGGFEDGARRSDIQINLTLSFEEAAFGVDKNVGYMRTEACSSCGGTGAKSGSAFSECKTCRGRGEVNVQQDIGFTRVVTKRRCSDCNGTGKIIKDPCPSCSGRGVNRKNTTVTIPVPGGIEDGMSLSMAGGGDKPRNGPPGDLIIAVSVRPHKLFKRKGSDLYVTVPIPFTTAILGGKINVPTLKGNVSYDVPEGTQHGALGRLRGHGAKIRGRESFGDIVMTFEVEMPRSLRGDARKLVKELADEIPDNQYDKVKNFNR
ncbi:MAG: J domain-containing protein [Firmicutes bacterium]|nr:J domain-containing protein [Bacillota bacterium]